jgi:hypothetical protein
MYTLSTGDPSTLGTYLRYTEALLGKESEGAKFFRDQIAEAPNGENEIVIAHESQMMFLIGEFAKKEAKNNKEINKDT